MCVDPYYKNNLSILGSVKNSIIETKNGRYHDFEKKFKNINSKYFHQTSDLKFPKIKKDLKII